jgi:hypothetical protein
MTHSIYEYRAVTWRHKYLPELSLDERLLVQLRQFLCGQETRGIFSERMDYPVFPKKTVNIRIAFGNILRQGLVRECKTGTSLHLLQFARDFFETSERAI